MLDAIRGFVTRNILRAPETSPPTHSRAPSGGVQLAACALLLELAHADGELSPNELAHIESALGRHFGLEQNTAAELIALAEAERSQSIDHFQFTRLIAQQYNLGQKRVLAEVMWGVILADGQIAQHEASLVRKLASLLDLEPAYLAQARSAAATTTPSSRSA
ncbi:MAG: TerB family tellurite resistance protein [Gemmatimonadales bacterium]|nr:TerB family tellurite resistance protein [Gemmatimonadales bacterium]